MRPQIQLAWSTILGAGLTLLTACGPVERAPSRLGQVYVTTDPPDAMIVCNGHMADNPTPTTLALPPGVHLLICKKPGYGEERRTVTCRISERTAVEIKLEPVYGLVLVQSRPAGADMEVDDAHRGKTPLLVHDFPLGRHRVKVSALGYLPKNFDVTVNDRTPQRLDATLISDSARLVITSTPAGARVVLDKTDIGVTPLEVPKVSSGAHTVDIILKGYSLYRDEFPVQAGEIRNLAVRLTPLPGKLTVITIPEKARLYVNDVLKGETPFTTNLPTTRYVLRTELAGYETWTSTNVVAAGEETLVEFHLKKNSGTLLISTEPPGISIYLDGEARGVTRPTAVQRTMSEQVTIDCIPQGPRKLQFTKPGYYDLNKTVEVQPNQTMILHEKLTPRPAPFVPNMIVRTGRDAEHTYKGIIREKYQDGGLKLEVEPGIFKTFRSTEILAIEPIPAPGTP